MKNIIIKFKSQFISIILSTIIVFLYYKGFIIGVRELIPHILTFSTIILALIGIIITLILNFRETTVFKDSIKKHPKNIKDMYYQTKKSIVLCIILIVMCIIILSTTINKIILLKFLIGWISSYTLFQMIITTTILLFNLLDIISSSDKYK